MIRRASLTYDYQSRLTPRANDMLNIIYTDCYNNENNMPEYDEDTFEKNKDLDIIFYDGVRMDEKWSRTRVFKTIKYVTTIRLLYVERELLKCTTIEEFLDVLNGRYVYVYDLLNKIYEACRHVGPDYIHNIDVRDVIYYEESYLFQKYSKSKTKQNILLIWGRII